MAKLIYSGIMSLDGYITDEDGTFDWSAPDPEVHEFVNDLERPIGTYLYGRRMYEVMAYWETGPGASDPPPHTRIRRNLAVGRQDRLLQHPPGSRQCPDPDRTSLRLEAVRELKATAARRPQRRRGRAGEPGHQSGAG